MAIIDMQMMRYINILDRTSRVKTRRCFSYNNTIIFAVPKFMISQAIGPDASNVRRMQEVIGKKIRVIEEASDVAQAEKFVADVVYPIKFKSLEMKDGILILNAGSQSKASLIGRNKRRLEELGKIVQDTFGIDLRIV